jgi:hypothetical protein
MIGVSVLLIGLSIIMLIHAFIRAKNAAFYVANDCTWIIATQSCFAIQHFLLSSLVA